MLVSGSVNLHYVLRFFGKMVPFIVGSKRSRWVLTPRCLTVGKSSYIYEVRASAKRVAGELKRELSIEEVDFFLTGKTSAYEVNG